MYCKVFCKIKKLIPLRIKKKIRIIIDCLKSYENLKQVDKNIIPKAMKLLSDLGVEEIYLSNTRRKDAEWWNQLNEKGNNEMPVVKTRTFANPPKTVNRWHTSFYNLNGFCRGILDIDFDELYLLMVKSIARSYKKICIINYGVLSKRLQTDLAGLGINFDMVEIDRLRVNHKTHIIIVDKDYDLVWCPVMNWFRYKAFSEDGKAVFFMPAAGWYMNHYSRLLGYEYEYDIALNIITNMRKMGVDVIVLEDILKYKRDNNYQIDPLTYVNKTGDKKSYDIFFKTYPFNALKSSQGGWCVHGNFIGMQDYKDEYRECIAGERVTCNSAYDDKPNVYFIGPCTFFGGGYVADNYTIESMVQQLGNTRFNCHNMTTDWVWSPLRMRTLPLKSNDVIVLVSYNDSVWKTCGISLISLKDVFAIRDEEYRSYTWDIPYHCNEKMNERFAKLIESELEKNYKEGNTLENNEKRININLLYDYKVDISQFILQNNKNLQQWYEKYVSAIKKGSNGAIVMNCNPFTYGHKYLIKYAAERVEHLYIFVVEEDKSYYSFEDRFLMVEQNCKTMENVSVLSSGKFMISVSTLAGYFDKDSLQDRNIFDALYDLELFGSVISKLFHIVYRFVGEEPTDGYTNNYNKQMKTLLPNYGIEVVEVPRLQIEGQTVSGSYCRKLYEQKKWDVLEKYLPKETMNVLRKDGQ